MLKDHSQTLDRLQQGLGRAFKESSLILGVPGLSVAVKLDPYYYLAVMPAFMERLSQWAGVFPHSAQETLICTGNLVSHGSKREFMLPLRLTWGDPPTTRRINASFVQAEFVDRALRLYGASPDALAVSDIRIDASDKEAVQKFFDNKTCVDKTAFTQQV